MSFIHVARNSGPWVMAGILSGMAILTRATGLVLVGVVGIALLLQALSKMHAGKSFWPTVGSAAISGIVWLVSAAGTVYLLLPALWVAPESTIRKLWSWSSNAATEGHENPTFFRGIHHDDPGLWVYPIVLAWRTSPAEWIGIVLLILLGFWGCQKRIPITSSSKLIIVCTVFVVVYVGAMSIGAKKFDRYILPVFPVIALLAAHGLMLAKSWIDRHNPIRWKPLGYTVLAIGVMVQVLAWDSARPYRLDYYNPILGGAEQAQHVLQMGWGQGGDQVVNFLNTQAVDGPITVQTSAVPSAFTYFLADDSPVEFKRFSLETPAGWYETDFYVAGIQQIQRGIALEYYLLEDQQPVYSVYIGGVSYFDIYNVRNLPLPDELAAPTACNLTFGDSVTLMQVVGRDEVIDFYFLTTHENIRAELAFDITLEWPDGLVSRETSTLRSSPSGYMSRLTIPYPDSTMPLNEATITMRASDSSQPLAVTTPGMPNESYAGETHSECFYSAPLD